MLDAGGDYLLTVKRNQPSLHRALVAVFDPEARPLLHRQECSTSDKLSREEWVSKASRSSSVKSRRQFEPDPMHQTAAAPPTISDSSFVIAACRVLL